MLHKKIRDALIVAMKEKDALRVETLRGILSASTNMLVEMKKKPDEMLQDEHMLSLFEKLVKQRGESIAMYEKGGRADMVEKEKKERDILCSFLPTPPSLDEIRAMVAQEIGSSSDEKPHKGKVLGIVLKKCGPCVETQMVHTMVDEAYTEKE